MIFRIFETVTSVVQRRVPSKPVFCANITKRSDRFVRVRTRLARGPRSIRCAWISQFVLFQNVVLGLDRRVQLERMVPLVIPARKGIIARAMRVQSVGITTPCTALARWVLSV